MSNRNNLNGHNTKGYRTNVSNILVIGSGGAGLRTTIAAHQRVDFPDKDPARQINFTVRMDENGELLLGQCPVAQVGEGNDSVLKSTEEYGLSDLLLV
jgi:hypothetical protein